MVHDLTPLALSTISGYVSLACWVIVYSPQIWENYVLKSGEGLSVPFIILWLLGDICNLAGGALAHLLPTMIILAVYYTACDFVLLFQVYWYRARRSHPPSEAEPLLPPPPAQPKPVLPAYVLYPLLTLFVIAVGVVSWLAGPHDDVGVPEAPGGDGDGVELEWKSQVLGYASAALYLGSRIPQIAHNYKTRCAGLSLAMFFFSISGNVTYVASILFKSLSPHYLLANASWLAGSGLVIFLDLFVLAQFAVFSYQDRREKVFADDEAEREAAA
ncbi:putative vacuolar membrane transporter for cationic amino acids [Cryptotrichosporon argae]